MMLMVMVIAVMVIDMDYCFLGYLMITFMYSRIIVCNKVIIVIEEVVPVLNVLIIEVFIVVNTNVNFIVEQSMLFCVLPLHIFFYVNFIVEHSTLFCVFPPQIFFYLLFQAQLHTTTSIIYSSVWTQLSNPSVLKLKIEDEVSWKKEYRSQILVSVRTCRPKMVKWFFSFFFP